ncbi:hypothetical protein [Streptomyces sp. NPDC004286]|uniref:hypothetical protein n=1 Tax=Streptomyces sp. NPDC004286 TaxID=3364696 RepID=UPI0036CBE7DC
MSGGERYWNEDTQRWEDGTADRAGVTPPPPSRPAHPPAAPVWPPAEPSEATPASTWPPADRRTPPAEAPGADPSPPAADRPADAPSSPADPPPPVRPAASADPSGSAQPPAGSSRSGEPPAPERPPATSSGAAAPSASVDSSAPAAQATGAPPPASAWPPADRRTPPPAAWPPAAPSSTEPQSPAWPPSAPADPPTAAWPPAHHPDPPSASWSPTATNPELPVTAPWPPVDPAPEPPAKDSGRRVLWLVLVGAAVAGVAVSLVLTQVVGKDKKGDDARPVVRHSSSAPVTPSPSPTPSPTPSPSAPPAGYELRDDSEGFRVAVPEGWKRAEVPSQYGMSVVNFRSPDRERRLQVYEVSEASPDASFDLYLSDQTAKPRGFEKLALTNLDEGDFTGSRLEYLADAIRDEPEVGTWHVYDERFVAADGKIYALAAYGANADGGEDELELLTTALAWFCPPGMNCDPAGNAALD